MSLSSGPVLIIGSQKPDADDLDLWHRCLGDTSHRAIREAARNKLTIKGVVLDQNYFNDQNGKSHLCACEDAPDFVSSCLRLPGGIMFPGARMSADVLIMQNSRLVRAITMFFPSWIMRKDVLGILAEESKHMLARYHLLERGTD